MKHAEHKELPGQQRSPDVIMIALLKENTHDLDRYANWRLHVPSFYCIEEILMEDATKKRKKLGNKEGTGFYSSEAGLDDISRGNVNVRRITPAS